jgi:hypothetical protein
MSGSIISGGQITCPAVAILEGAQLGSDFSMFMGAPQTGSSECPATLSPFYPKIHSGALVVNHSEVASGLSRLVQEPQFRAEVPPRCRQDAGKYHVKSTVDRLAGLFAQVRQTIGLVAD